MNRREALKLLAATTVAAAPTVRAQTKYQWKMVTTWPKNFPGLGTGANHLAEMIEQMSQGRIKIRIFGAGELVPALGIFDAVSRGTAEMGHGAAYYWKGKHEATQFFAAVPFGFTAQEMHAWFYYGGAQKLWDELYAPFNLKPFCAGNTGVQMGGWFRKEVKSVNDFKGLKMRMPGLGGEVLQKLGAVVVNIPGGDIFQALKSGVIDATEWVGPYNDLAFGLHKGASLYYWPGWHEPGTPIECFINKKTWEALPSDLKAIIQYACQAATKDMLSEMTTRNGNALQALITEHKVQLKKFSDDILKKLAETSKEVVATVGRRDPFSKKVYDSFESFRKKMISWGKISEEGYSLARSLSFQ